MYSSIALCTIHTVRNQIRTFSSWKTETQYLSNNNSPSPFLPPAPDIHMNLTTLGISYILAWEIPWTEECDGVQSMESQRVGHD